MKSYRLEPKPINERVSKGLCALEVLRDAFEKLFGIGLEIEGLWWEVGVPGWAEIGRILEGSWVSLEGPGRLLRGGQEVPT